MAFVVTCVAVSSETEMLRIDESRHCWQFDPPIDLHVIEMHRGRDFPRSRILTPDNLLNNPRAVAASGVAQPGDFVVGNKFASRAGSASTATVLACRLCVYRHL